MKIRVSLTTPDWGLLSAQYKCMTCESTSPRIEFPGDTANDEIIERLQAAAMRRAEPKNRVLTLEEARNAEVDTFGTAMHWLELKIRPYRCEGEEIKCAVLSVSIFFEDESEDGVQDVMYSCTGEPDAWLHQRDYGRSWRCWLRKPTKEEMEETPWNGGAEE
jgi:hypothetical protein